MSKIFTPMADYSEMIFTNGGTSVDAGELVTKNDVKGFPLVDVGANAKMTLIIACPKVKIKKNESLAINAGDAIYYDDADENVNKTPTDNTFVGFAIEDAGVSDEYCYAYFDGTREFTKINGLGDIADVSIVAGPYDGNALVYGSSVWSNKALNLNDLFDVNASSPTNGQQLTWDSTEEEWTAGSAS